jgi:hypothetical protein
MRLPAVVMVTVREPSATASRLESNDQAGRWLPHPPGSRCTAPVATFTIASVGS